MTSSNTPSTPSDRPSVSPDGPVPGAGVTAPEVKGKKGRREPKPPWLKVPLPGGEGYTKLKALTKELNLNTVCEEARCPNIGECWKGDHATMTIMVLGDECTRRCRFCAVKTVDRAKAPDPHEPEHVGRAVGKMALDYLVITSVDRDDLADGGSKHYADCVRSIRTHSPETLVEVLIPDYTGENLETMMASRPDVLAHNVEVVPRLQRKIRDPRCSYERSLDVLRQGKAYAAEQGFEIFTKSSLMVGLGETQDELFESIGLLRDAGVDFLTLGQYLRPTPNHAPVRDYVTPERFRELEIEARALGFLYVASGPLVRSSYKAGEYFATRLIKGRRAMKSSSSPKEGSPKEGAPTS
ncbi:MAG: lipoic acid synthetase [Paracoccaceae bacterium]|jgi:lipoic acid synthetase